MTDLPPGEPFHHMPPSFHAYVKTKDLELGIKYVTRLALDRARQAGFNPRKGIVTVGFDDDGVAAKWEERK